MLSHFGDIAFSCLCYPLIDYNNYKVLARRQQFLWHYKENVPGCAKSNDKRRTVRLLFQSCNLKEKLCGRMRSLSEL